MRIYYLLDLERTIGHQKPFFWKANKRGYSPNLEEAGLYTKEEAEKIVKSDIENFTVMLSDQQIYRCLGMIVAQ